MEMGWIKKKKKDVPTCCLNASKLYKRIVQDKREMKVKMQYGESVYSKYIFYIC